MTARSESVEYSTRKRPLALTVAGSDTGGGAGIQADLKVFALNRVYGCTVITGLTAQNTLGVQGVHPVPLRFLSAQFASVLGDFPVDAVKTGMLWSRPLVHATVEALTRLGRPVVVDPVMVAKGGARLLRDDAVEAVRGSLLRIATVVTPNLDEAEVLLGYPVRTVAAMRRAARELVALGAAAALVKGGHLARSARDVFFDGTELIELEHERVATRHTHGTGCVLSASIAARLAQGIAIVPAVRAAVTDVQAILAVATPLGAGHGPADPLLARAQFGRRAAGRSRR